MEGGREGERADLKEEEGREGEREDRSKKEVMMYNPEREVACLLLKECQKRRLACYLSSPFLSLFSHYLWSGVGWGGTFKFTFDIMGLQSIVPRNANCRVSIQYVNRQDETEEVGTCARRSLCYWP